MVTIGDDGLLDELRLLTVAEAAQLVRVPAVTIRAWIRSGAVASVKHDGRRLVGEQSVLDCELAMRRSPMGRPREGTARGR